MILWGAGISISRCVHLAVIGLATEKLILLQHISKHWNLQLNARNHSALFMAFRWEKAPIVPNGKTIISQMIWSGCRQAAAFFTP
jgi:hypothetical protein